MPDDDSLKPLLEKLCALEEQQLSKLNELVEHYSVLAKGGQKNDELFQRNAQLWEQDHKMYVEREERREKRTTRHALIILIILALIPVAIIVARFL
jgi:hypothetical protein